ncbi:hypothetical protein ACFR99_01655 [Haloarchaeobius amylolyticus]|uniref:Uncharacterized protein n=1 Tax=Haloarchaeobius amylolyticus TaxID=1198296 RepID=A0ABD6BBC7_9EURY
MTDQSIYSRRNLLAATGTAAATVVAGCNSSNNSENREPNSSSKPEEDDLEPDYQAAIGFKDGATDLEGEDRFEMGIDIQRTLDGETETLSQENIAEVTGYTVRNHPDYSEELLEEAGLFTEIDGMEYTEGNIWQAAKEEVLPGNTTLHLEITAEDPEYGREITKTVETELTINKNPEEIYEETLVDDKEIHGKLREDYLEEELERSTPRARKTWKEVGENAIENAHNEWDIENLSRKDQLQRYAMEWIQEAGPAIGGSGQPSGQANFLAATLETELDNVTTGTMYNTGHKTVLLHDHDTDQTYHVETGRGGLTHQPPSEAGYPEAHRNQTPLWTTENNLDQAEGTLQQLTALSSNREYMEEVEHAFGHNMNWENDLLINAMTRLRKGKGGELIESLQDFGLTAELSPEIDYQAEGTATDMEVAAL